MNRPLAVVLLASVLLAGLGLLVQWRPSSDTSSSRPLASPEPMSGAPAEPLHDDLAWQSVRSVPAGALQQVAPDGEVPSEVPGPAQATPWAATEALQPPPPFRDWRAYAEDNDFNPSQTILSGAEIAALEQLLAGRTKRIRALQDEAARHLGALIDMKIHNGDCQIVGTGAAIGSEPGRMVGLNISHDGIRRIVRVYPGDYAPLDLTYADMWRQFKLGEEAVKTFLAQR